MAQTINDSDTLLTYGVSEGPASLCSLEHSMFACHLFSCVALFSSTASKYEFPKNLSCNNGCISGTYVYCFENRYITSL